MGIENDDSLSWMLIHLEKLSIQWKLKQSALLLNRFFYFFFSQIEPAAEAANLKHDENQFESKSCRKWRIIASVQCHLHILYVSHCQENFITSKHEHKSQFYNDEHMSCSCFVFMCALHTHTRLFTIRIASSISTNYNKLAKYSPNSSFFALPYI